MEEILIWESNVERIRACESAVYQALKELGLKARVTVNSEPPLISRNQLWERLPVLEIQGLRWSLHPGRAFTAEQLTRLFGKIFADRIGKGPIFDAGGGQAGAADEMAGEGDANAR